MPIFSTTAADKALRMLAECGCGCGCVCVWCMAAAPLPRRGLACTDVGGRRGLYTVRRGAPVQTGASLHGPPSLPPSLHTRRGPSALCLGDDAPMKTRTSTLRTMLQGDVYCRGGGGKGGETGRGGEGRGEGKKSPHSHTHTANMHSRVHGLSGKEGLGGILNLIPRWMHWKQRVRIIMNIVVVVVVVVVI